MPDREDAPDRYEDLERQVEQNVAALESGRLPLEEEVALAVATARLLDRMEELLRQAQRDLEETAK
ncbi:protein of unknown function [Candidatus Hydrogenisulfobacillus filiaventi]|uniref:Uncharacterized protein n=1 Tax=Candidatus Hydrogenisulfobacillus filiaventi TaxID=2707344 RepID=A0A6F8ZHS1_9FIRM|nr:protein of unknown function [Candidatus Hydrogenisulfobacillus filiaventi]